MQQLNKSAQMSKLLSEDDNFQLDHRNSKEPSLESKRGGPELLTSLL